MTDAVSDTAPLPLQGRPERAHLYAWMAVEEPYVASKFDDQRDSHDDSLRTHGLVDFWERQIVQYLDRANQFLEAAAAIRSRAIVTSQEGRQARHLEQRAQQAMAKAMMTAKGLCESSIRVFGPLPKPGVASGTVEEWTDVPWGMAADHGRQVVNAEVGGPVVDDA